MSAISEQVRAAIGARLQTVVGQELTYGGENLTYGGEQLTYGTGDATGAYYGVAPETASYPFIVFQRVPGTTDYAFHDTLIGERDRYLIKSYADEDAGTVSPTALNESIRAAAEAAIGNSLTLTTATAHRVTRIADLPELWETVNDRLVVMNGFQLETYAG